MGGVIHYTFAVPFQADPSWVPHDLGGGLRTASCWRIYWEISKRRTFQAIMPILPGGSKPALRRAAGRTGASSMVCDNWQRSCAYERSPAGGAGDRCGDVCSGRTRSVRSVHQCDAVRKLSTQAVEAGDDRRERSKSRSDDDRAHGPALAARFRGDGVIN